MHQPVLPHTVRRLLHCIAAYGGHAWVVGGALRDLLRGKEPMDWDVATTLTPEELLGLFPYARMIGGHHGTVLVRWNSVGFEITPCREESGYTDGRHPDEVRFGATIFTDLARRDFTINAMAFDGELLIDPFGGQRDLARQLLRAVGEPEKRFEEDKLRILRMLRFAAVLGFTIEPATARAAMEAISGVSGLACERVRSEVDRILLSKRPYLLEPLIRGGGLARYGLEEAISLVPLAKVPPVPLYRWWALATLCGADVQEVGRRFGFSRRFVAELEECARLYLAGPSVDAVALKLKLRTSQLDHEALCDAFAALSPPYKEEPLLLARVRFGREAYRVKELAVNGDDLVREGFAGIACGRVLDELLVLVIHEPQLNDKKTLIDLAHRLEPGRAGEGE